MSVHLDNLKQEFLTHSKPESVVKMSAYMLNQFEFFGINTRLRRELSQTLIKSMASASSKKPFQLVNKLWAFPQREFQYVAIDIMKKFYKKLNDVPRLFGHCAIMPNVTRSVSFHLLIRVNIYYRRLPIEKQPGIVLLLSQ